MRTRLHDTDAAFRARRISLYVAVGLLILGLARVWTQQLANAGSFIGLLSAGIAIALSDGLKNLAGACRPHLSAPGRVVRLVLTTGRELSSA